MHRLLSLPQAMSSPACARRTVGDFLAPLHLSEEQQASVRAVVSELVANGVMHGGSEVDLVLRTGPDAVRVEVVDYGGGTPTMLAPPAEADRGRGLLVVEALSTRWGVVQQEGWKLVWAEFAVEPPGAGAPSRRPRLAAQDPVSAPTG